jgi:Ca2+-binding RTX toxin-like protein
MPIINGDNAANTINGTTGDDQIFGFDGNDQIYGNGGNDSIDGGIGDDLVFGGSGSDTIIGGDGNDAIAGYGGNDNLQGGAGSDYLTGGTGSDVIDGGSGLDLVNYSDYALSGVNVSLVTGLAVAGSDTDTLIGIENINGSLQADVLVGDANSNQITGNGGSDTLTGGAGSDVFSFFYQIGSTSVTVITDFQAGAGGDNIIVNNLPPGIGNPFASGYARLVQSGADTLIQFDDDGYGSAFSLRTVGILQNVDKTQLVAANFNGSDPNAPTATAGNDSITGTAGNDQLYGLDGDDTLIALDGQDSLYGGNGNDSLNGGNGSDYLDGGADNDSLEGGSNGDFLTGSTGNDTLRGGAGFDNLQGGAGDDLIDGGSDSDSASYIDATFSVNASLTTGVVTGGAGNDTLVSIETIGGSLYNDTLEGSAVNNYLYGSDGNDSIIGLDGNDLLSGDNGNDTILGGQGLDSLSGGLGDDVLDGGADQDRIDYLSATSAVNVSLLTGLSSGGGGNDTLISIEHISGSNYNDTLIGDAGINIINGFGGSDTITGGAGQDFFDYTSASAPVGPVGSPPPPPEIDVITDFQAGALGDSISLPFYIGGNPFANGYIRLIQTGADTHVQRDTDGPAGAGSFQTFVILQNVDKNNLVSENFSGFDPNALPPSTGNDSLIGTSGADSINALAGDDTIRGQDGNDTLNGDAGNDSIDGGNGNDSLRGGTENDSIFGGAGADSLFGDAGNDTLLGGDDGDYFQGGTGDDLIDGGNNNNAIATDFVDYFNSTGAMTINLTTGLASGGDQGNDTLVSIDGIAGSNYNDTIIGSSGFDFIRGGLGNDSLDGGAGIDDVVDYVTATTAVSVNLATGVASGGAGNDTITGFEQIRGGSGNDYLIGDSQNNSLRGNLGNDTLDGGAGNDRADYLSATGSVFIDLEQGTATGAAGNDVLISIERARGSNFNDVLEAGNAPSTLEGAGGNDTLVGGDGADFLTGGAGDDTIDGNLNDTRIGSDWSNYSDATSGVNVNLANGTATGGGGSDTLFSIDAVGGSAFNDSIVGDAGSNFLRGNQGDDTLDGGAGFDFADYFNATGSITATFTGGGNGSVTGADGNDTLLNIEAISATNFNDTLIGSAADERFRGRLGDDYVDGGAGSDTFDFRTSAAGVYADLVAGTATGEGNDTFINIENLRGSELGNDTLIGNAGDNIFQGHGGNDSIDGAGGSDTASYSNSYMSGVVVNLALGTASNDGWGTSDILINIENVNGSWQDDSITGSASNNRLFGDLGNDTLDGGIGVDTLEGGAGDDTYILTDLNDIITELVGGGSDTLSVNFSHYLQGANIENLTLTGAAAYGVGTAEANILTGNAGENLLIAGEGADTIYGGGARDAIFGENGADLIYGEDGIDYLIGGEGADTIYGGNQADEIYGQDGADLIYGGQDFQTDILVGGAGNDTIDGGDAWDQVYGGTGDDSFYVSQQVDWVFEFAGEGNDTVYSRSSNGYYLYDQIENLILLDNSPFGVGNGLANRITGNAIGNTLLGGGGNDTLDGGAGQDILWGEAGADTFKISQGTGLDIIADWLLGTDKLDVSAYGFANLAAAKANMLQVGGDISMNLGNGDALIILGVNINNISATDLILS